MRSILALVLILLAAAVGTARAENTPPEKELRATLAQTVVESAAPAAPQMLLTEVPLPSREAATADALATQDMPARGSFWWLVGAIVVAGLILVVILD